MLRSILVAIFILIGGLYALKGPFYGLLFYLWIAYFRPDAWLWADWTTDINLSYVVGLTAVGLTILHWPRRWPRPDWRMALLGLFFIQTLISAVTSEAPDWSWEWWTDFAKVLIIGYLLLVHVTDMRRCRLVFATVALSAGAEAAKQGLVLFFTNPGGRNDNMHPVFGDNNGLAVAMFMLVPILMALANTATATWQKAMYRSVAVGVILRGLTTYSRGGFLCAGLLFVLHLLHSQRKLRSIAAAALLVSVVLPTLPDTYWERMRTIASPNEERDASAAGRIHFWRVAVDMAQAHPLTGVGFNAFSRVYDRYDYLDGQYGTNRAVHSAWFGSLAELGLPGLVLFVGLLSQSLFNCASVRRLARAKPHLAEVDVFAAALQTTLLVFSLGATFINAHYNELGWHLIYLTMALRAIAIATLSTDQVATPPRPVPFVDHGSRSWPVPGRLMPNSAPASAQREAWSRRR